MCYPDIEELSLLQKSDHFYNYYLKVEDILVGYQLNKV